MKLRRIKNPEKVLNEEIRRSAKDVPNIRVVSERFTSEADAKRLKREILMAYSAATVRIEKTDEPGGRSSAGTFFLETFCMAPFEGETLVAQVAQLRVDFE